MKEREREGIMICAMMIMNRWFSFLSFLGSVWLSGKVREREGNEKNEDGKDGREKITVEWRVYGCALIRISFFFGLLLCRKEETSEERGERGEEGGGNNSW